MNGSLRRNWWRRTALALVGGAAMAGGVGTNGNALAEPLSHPPEKGTPAGSQDAPPVWTRSATPSPVQTILKPKPTAVVPVAAQVPAVQMPSPSIPFTATPAPVAVVGAPMMPEFKPVPIPTAPGIAEPATSEPPTYLPPPLQAAPTAPPAKSSNPVNPVAPPPPDFNLRPGNGRNSVNPDAPSVPAIPVVPTIPVPAEPRAILTGQRTKPTEAHFAPTVKDVYAVSGAPAPLPIPLHPNAPGTHPMTIPSRSTTIAAVTGIALAFAPVQSATSQDKTDPVQLRKELDAANKKLDDADKEIKRLSALLDGKKDEKGVRLDYDPGAVEELKRLKYRVEMLEKQVAAMQSSTSLRPGPAIVGKGTIRVVNEYPVAVSIVINEKSYRVEPNTTLTVDVPVGEFSYQLLQSGVGATPIRSAIKDKEVVTLRVK